MSLCTEGVFKCSGFVSKIITKSQLSEIHVCARGRVRGSGGLVQVSLLLTFSKSLKMKQLLEAEQLTVRV